MAWGAIRPASALVGRREEQRRLLNAIRGADEGQPACLVVHGEAGVGKTRLVREVVAAEVDAEVLWGTCVRFGSSMLPFAPLISALRDVVPEQPELSGHSSFLRMVAAAIGAVAARRPAILVIDDLQWADQSSLDAVAYLIAGFRDQRLAVIATRRDEPLAAGHPLYGWLADMRRMPGFAELTLDRLDLVETAQLVASIHGGTPDLVMGAQVYARSGGNPYLTELLVVDLPPDADELPDTAPYRLREALSASWHRLSPVAREVTRIVAVGGRPADVPLLTAVAARQGIDAVAVSEALEREETHSVLVRDDGGLVWFRHPLLAEILDALTAPAVAAAVHAAFAEVLADRPEAAAADLAVHYAGCGQIDDAFTWSLSAAAAAEAVHASAEAAAHLTRACAIWPQVTVRRRGSTHARVELLARTCAANRRIGQDAQARGLIEKALHLVDESTDPLLRSRLLGEWYAVRWGHPDEREAVLRQRTVALRLAEGHPDSPERSLALSGLSEAEFRTGNVTSAQEHAQAALELARRSGSDLALAHALAAEALALPFRLEGRARHLEELERAAYASGTIEAIRLSASRMGDFLQGQGDLPGTARVMHRAFAEIKRLGDRTMSYYLAEIAADNLIDCGRFEEAQRLLQEALVARCVSPAGALSRLIAAKLATRTGDLRAARLHVDRALEVLDPMFSLFERELLTAPSELLAAEGDLEGAANWIRERLAAGGGPRPPVAGLWEIGRFEQPPQLPGEPYQDQLYDRADAVAFLGLTHALAELAERARDEGRPEAAGRVVAELAGWEDAFRERLPGLSDPAVRPTDPDLLVARAEMARCRDDADQVEWWRQAVDRCHERGFLWNEACGLLRLAEAQVADGTRRADLAVTLRRLHELATTMGAGPLQKQAETLARVARISLAAACAPRAVSDEGGRRSPLDALTAREREVLGHLVAGRTNSEIAQSLFISEKTASVHVTNILRKTGTSSRVEAAAWATRLT